MKSEDEQREKLYKLLGILPDRNRPISSRLISREKKNGYWLEKLLLDLNGFEEVPAYFFYQKKAAKRYRQFCLIILTVEDTRWARMNLLKVPRT